MIKRPSFVHPILAFIFAVGLSACQTTARYTSHPSEPAKAPVRVTKPSTSSTPKSTSTAPKNTPDSGEPSVSGEAFYVAEGRASYYAEEFNGRKTSSGEVYNMNEYTAAHRTLPFGAKVKITNLDNGKSANVRINDRGPWKRNRILDMSLAAAKKLGMIGPGSARVRLEAYE